MFQATLVGSEDSHRQAEGHHLEGAHGEGDDAVGDVDRLLRLLEEIALRCVADALTALGFWRDDSQVYAATVEKFYAAKTGRAGAEIEIQQFP